MVRVQRFERGEGGECVDGGVGLLRVAYVEVRYASDDECAAVEQQLQGKELQGKKIHIARTPPKSDGEGSASAHGPAAAAAASEVDEADPLSVFVKNLPRNEPDIVALVRAHFEPCGEVVSVDIPKNAAAAGAPAGSSGVGFKNFGTVVFRTGPGDKLDILRRQPNVAFEADGVDQESGIAWSVMIEGTAELFQGIEELVDSFSLMLFPWEPGPKEQFVRIVPASVTGRRFHVAEPMTWWKHMKHG